jgi:HTH-type transcriptional regulator/antitoxin HigA
MIARAMSSVTVRPVRTEADYDAALRDIDALMDARPGTSDGDRLDVLVTLVQAYEARHHPVPPPDPVDAIRFRMEQAGLTPRDLEPYIGSRARVSEVLNRRRSLTLPMIRRLAEGLQLAAEVLVREAPPVTGRKRRTRSTTTAAATKAGRGTRTAKKAAKRHVGTPLPSTYAAQTRSALGAIASDPSTPLGVRNAASCTEGSHAADRLRTSRM